MDAAAYDERKHKRHPRGTPLGGKFAEKPGSGIDSPEFKRWFGASKVVDGLSGKPLVVYHGSQHSFDSFQPKDTSGKSRFWVDIGTHFALDPEVANKYAQLDKWDMPRFGADIKPGDAPQVYPAYLRIENPLDLTQSLPEPIKAKVLERLDALGKGPRAKSVVLIDADPIQAMDIIQREEGRDGLKRFLTELGFDGAKYEWQGVNYVVFEPTQIKSAIGNRGTYDPDDPDITAAHDERKHPRHPKGTPKGGKWRETSTTTAIQRIAPHAAQAVEEIERRLLGYDIEVGVLVGMDGKILHERDGSEYAVDYSRTEIEELVDITTTQDAIYTHNHPSGANSVSNGDICFASVINARAMRAVGRDPNDPSRMVTYTIERPEGGWPNADMMDRRFRTDPKYAQVLDSVEHMRMANGRLAPRTEMDVSHRLVQMAVEDFGFPYHREFSDAPPEQRRKLTASIAGVPRGGRKPDGGFVLDGSGPLGLVRYYVSEEREIESAYTEQKHPRYPVGHPRAGQWMEKADAPEAAESGRGNHQPQRGSRAFDLLEKSDASSLPSDVYEHPEFATGYTEKPFIKETIEQLRQVRGKPDAMLTIYRAVPAGVKKLETGDWVSLSQSYAKAHASMQDEPFEVIRQEVPARDVRYGGGDILEYGYFPDKLAAAYQEHEHPRLLRGHPGGGRWRQKLVSEATEAAAGGARQTPWGPVPRNMNAGLRAIAAARQAIAGRIGELPNGTPEARWARNSASNVAELTQDATEGAPALVGALERAATGAGAEINYGPDGKQLVKPERSLRWTQRTSDPVETIRSLTDPLRATLIVDTPEQIAPLAASLDAAVRQAGGAVAFDNKFAYSPRLHYGAVHANGVLPVGTRSVKFEVQIHLRGVQAVRERAHEILMARGRHQVDGDTANGASLMLFLEGFRRGLGDMSGAYEERKHPRYPRGTPLGGEWIEKPGDAADLGEPSTKKPQTYGSVVFDRERGLGEVSDQSNVDYKGFTVFMTPRQFLALNPERTKPHDDVREGIASGLPIAPPYLNVIETSKGWQVYSHEGRGRALSLNETQPDVPIPVDVFPILRKGDDRGEFRTKNENPSVALMPIYSDRAREGEPSVFRPTRAIFNEYWTGRERADTHPGEPFPGAWKNAWRHDLLDDIDEARAAIKKAEQGDGDLDEDELQALTDARESEIEYAERELKKETPPFKYVPRDPKLIDVETLPGPQARERYDAWVSAVGDDDEYEKRTAFRRALLEAKPDPGTPGKFEGPAGDAFKKWFGRSQVVDENNQPRIVYHGTTRDFSEFDQERANPESDWGAGFYFTSDPDDVETNYAGLGPDLTNKIEHRAEQLEQGDGENDPMEREEALAKARSEFVEHPGATMPVYLRMENPAIIGGENETKLTYDSNYDEEADEYGEPEGTLVDFAEDVRHVASMYNDADPDKALQELMQLGLDDGEVSLAKVVETLKTEAGGLVYAMDDEGRMVQGEIIRQALERAGFDGIIDYTVPDKFGPGRKIGRPMEGMDEDTVHYVAFHPTHIKSAIANKGTFSLTSEDISALSAPPHLRSLMAAARMLAEYEEQEHPRHPAGTPLGGRWIEKRRDSTPAPVGRDEYVFSFAGADPDTRERMLQTIAHLPMGLHMEAIEPADAVAGERLVWRTNTTGNPTAEREFIVRHLADSPPGLVIRVRDPHPYREPETPTPPAPQSQGEVLSYAGLDEPGRAAVLDRLRHLPPNVSVDVIEPGEEPERERTVWFTRSALDPENNLGLFQHELENGMTLRIGARVPPPEPPSPITESPSAAPPPLNQFTVSHAGLNADQVTMMNELVRNLPANTAIEVLRDGVLLTSGRIGEQSFSPDLLIEGLRGGNTLRVTPPPVEAPPEPPAAAEPEPTTGPKSWAELTEEQQGEVRWWYPSQLKFREQVTAEARQSLIDNGVAERKAAQYAPTDSVSVRQAMREALKESFLNRAALSSMSQEQKDAAFLDAAKKRTAAWDLLKPTPQMRLADYEFEPDSIKRGDYTPRGRIEVKDGETWRDAKASDFLTQVPTTMNEKAFIDELGRQMSTVADDYIDNQFGNTEVMKEAVTIASIAKYNALSDEEKFKLWQELHPAPLWKPERGAWGGEEYTNSSNLDALREGGKALAGVGAGHADTITRNIGEFTLAIKGEFPELDDGQMHISSLTDYNRGAHFNIRLTGSTEETTDPQSWDDLSSQQQSDAEQEWFKNNEDSYTESEVDNWREGGGAKYVAAGKILDGDIGDVEDLVRQALDDEGLQLEEDFELKDYILARGTSDIGDVDSYNDDLRFTSPPSGVLDPSLLNHVSFAPRSEMELEPGEPWPPWNINPDTTTATLPGVSPPPDPIEAKQKMLDKVVENFRAKLDDAANESGSDVDPPDWVTESAREAMRDHWDSMNDEERFQIAASELELSGTDTENVEALDMSMDIGKYGSDPGLSAQVGLVELAEPFQGKGKTQSMMARFFGLMQALGVRTLYFTAAGGGYVGSYAWAKLGIGDFIREDQRESFAQMFKERVEATGDAEALARLNAMKTLKPADIANFKLSNGDKIGKQFLLTRSWDGKMQIPAAA